MLQGFFGGKNQQLTPEMVEALRERSDAAGARSRGPLAGTHWSHGLASLVDAWGGYKGNMRADKAEEEGMAGADSVIAALLGQGAPSFAPPMDAGGIPDVNVQPVAQNDVSGAFAGSGAASGQNFPMSLVQSESGGNWNALNSEGYGGRLQFGKDRLADAARAGVIPAGMTGAQFSQLPPEQQQAVEQWHFNDIDSQAQRMGLDQYIGQNVAGIPITQDGIRAMAHLGGIGGAAKFLQSGGQYNPADSNGTSLADYAMKHGAGGGMSAGGGAGLPSGGSSLIPLLMEGMDNPWVQKKYGPVIQALMGQEMQRQNATFEQQLRQQDPMYQAQLAKLTTPEPVNPWDGIQVINGQAVRMTPEGPQVVGDYRTPETPEMPAAVQALQWRAEQAGLQPGTAEYTQFMIDGGRSDGFAIDVDPVSGAVSVRQGAGAGKSAPKETEGGMASAGFLQRMTAAEKVLDDLASKGVNHVGLLEGLAVGTRGEGYALSAPKQQLIQAQRDWVRAKLRKESGAVIGDEEMAEEIRTYFPQPGDAPEVIAQKRNSRKAAERQLQITAGASAEKAGPLTDEDAPQLSDDDYLKSLGLE